MFLFPIRTDRRLRRTPWVNYTLIVANVVLYLMTRDKLDDPAVSRYMLYPDFPELFQFITYQFLHAGAWHLLANMLFLYVFGNSVEDRIGAVGYLGFYLAGGVFAGVGHCLTEAAPVLGASGAVAAVTGAYLALFPSSNVTIAYWFVIIGAFEVSSLLLIGFQVAQNVVFHVFKLADAAYVAHLTGYVYGFAVGMALLVLRLLDREPGDMLAVISHWRRRAEFRRLTRDGFQPWQSEPAAGVARGASGTHGSTFPSDAGARTGERPVHPRVIELRGTIGDAIAHHDLSAAADAYVELLDCDAGQVMPRQQQMDIANQLMANGVYDMAARAYELYLHTYPSDGNRDQVELMLALVYTRYLGRKQRARELLRTAMPRLHDQGMKDLAQKLLTELPAT